LAVRHPLQESLVNNECPACGAIYNVASKDIGRRLKCKKCNAALTVTDRGLEEDKGTGPAPPVESNPDRDRDRDDHDDSADDEEPVKKKKKRRDDYDRGPRINPLELVGGIPTIIFAAGVFLVIVFTAFPIIGQAGSARANAYTQKLQNEQKQEILDLKPRNKKESEWTDAEKKRIEEETPKIEARYARLIEQAALDADRIRIANTREVWFEMYGLMFGFVLVAFGCIGYLRTDQHLVLKIVAGTILAFIMLIMFLKFGGCTPPR
jgi:DNA-directed RNA polymerase subunit M/transcription elongation factor TFIIS